MESLCRCSRDDCLCRLCSSAFNFSFADWLFPSLLGVIPSDQRNLTVVRGETVTLNCNITMENIKQTEWYKDKIIFNYQHSTKRNVSRLPSDRLQMNIDTNNQSTLKLLNAQPDDAGHYRCSVVGLTGNRRIVWNLLVSEGPEGEGRQREDRATHLFKALTDVLILSHMVLCRRQF